MWYVVVRIKYCSYIAPCFIKQSKYSQDTHTSSLGALSEQTLKMLTKPTTNPLDNIKFVSTMSSSTEMDQEVWIVSHADKPDKTSTYFFQSSVHVSEWGRYL